MSSKQKNNPIPTGKFNRAIITGKTSAYLGLKHIKHLAKKSFNNAIQNTKNNDQHQHEVGKILITTLTQLRGTALKVAQMMSMELDMLPEGIRQELAKACSDVTPLNRAHIRKVFIAEFNLSPEQVFEYFDNTAFAAASLGQVHLAQSNQQQKLAVKIQYPGISACIQSDIKLLRSIMKSLSVTTSLLPSYDFIESILNRIQRQLEYEIDYKLEAKNTQWFASNLMLENICIPKVNFSLSTTKVLTTEYLNGVHLEQWLKSNPTIEQRNYYGQLLFDLFCYQLHQLRVLHADPHPGNFIFCEHQKLALIDFGCIHHLNQNFPNNVVLLFTRDPNKLYLAYIQSKIINKNLSYQKFKKNIYPFAEDIIKWMTLPYQSETFNFATMPAMPKKSLSQLKTAVNNLDEMQLDQMYFDRSYFGLISMLRRIAATVNTSALLQYK